MGPPPVGPPPGRGHHPPHPTPPGNYTPYGAPGSYRGAPPYPTNVRLRYSRYGRRAWRPASPTSNVGWLIGGLVTLGLIYPVPAIVCWVRAYRFRAPRMTQSPALAWFIWAIVFSVLGAGAWTGVGLAAANDNGNSPGGSAGAPYTPPTTTTVPFGSTAHLQAEVAPPNDSHVASISMTVSNLVHRPNSGVADVNMTVRVRVCSTSTTIDPLAAAIPLNVVPVGGSPIFASDDWTLPTPFYTPLPPHRCVTGSVGYKFPTGATVDSFVFDGNAGQNVVWKLTPAQGSRTA